MLVLDNHESHISAEFEEYCKETGIIPLCFLAHSSYLTQLLDVGLFSPFKIAYGREISFLVWANITYIMKDNFFLCSNVRISKCWLSTTLFNISGAPLVGEIIGFLIHFSVYLSRVYMYNYCIIVMISSATYTYSNIQAAFEKTFIEQNVKVGLQSLAQFLLTLS